MTTTASTTSVLTTTTATVSSNSPTLTTTQEDGPITTTTSSSSSGAVTFSQHHSRQHHSRKDVDEGSRTQRTQEPQEHSSDDAVEILRKEIERLKTRLEEERKKLNDVTCKPRSIVFDLSNV